MSGHSKWATIKRAKGAADAKKGAVFTKLSKNISLAAKQGKDPEFNPSLRAAIEAAKEANMPKDNIEKAVLRGAGELPGQVIEEIVYEGYGPNGIALMMRAATDNTNRTSSFLKSTLHKHGGNLGGPGAVGFLFKQMGVLRVDDASETMQLQAMDAGAEDLVEEDAGLTIYTAPDQFHAVKNALGQAVTFGELTMRPLTLVDVTPETVTTFTKLLEELEDNEDMVDLYHNAKL
jgi:YebC/PmpR family DNA-binding regulatory protein